MPDDAIRLTLPPDADLAAVASVAVRAAARQVALPDTEIDRLRAALVGAIEARLATASAESIMIELQPSPGSLRVVLDGDPIA